jgi:hypothetical protein
MLFLHGCVFFVLFPAAGAKNPAAGGGLKNCRKTDRSKKSTEKFGRIMKKHLYSLSR